MNRGTKPRRPAPLRPPENVEPSETVQNDPDAARVYFETVDVMRRAGTLDGAFLAAVESYSLLAAMRARALRAAAKATGAEGLRLARFASGTARLLRGYESDLLLTPRSRERCKLPPPAASPAAAGALAFLKGGLRNDN